MARELTARKKNFSSGESKEELKRKLDKAQKEAPQWIVTDQIETEETFSSLFPLKDEALSAIEKSIAEKGFDPTEAISVWNKEGRLVLIDGHRRLHASRKAGLGMVPAHVLEFTDQDAAWSYAMLKQWNRRNIDDASFFQFVLGVDWDSLPEEYSSGRKQERLSRLTGKSVTVCVRALSIANSDREDLQKAILDGSMTINAAYNELKGKEKPSSPSVKEDVSAEKPKGSTKNNTDDEEDSEEAAFWDSGVSTETEYEEEVMLPENGDTKSHEVRTGRVEIDNSDDASDNEQAVFSPEGFASAFQDLVATVDRSEISEDVLEAMDSLVQALDDAGYV